LRVHSCFGLVVYFQKPLEWRKRNVRTDLQRYWDYFDFAATWWHPFKTMPEPGPLEPMPPEIAFFSMNTSGIEPFKLTKWEAPTPKPAGWRPHVPAFWGKRDDVSHYDYWTRPGKRQPHIQTPWDSEPAPMPWNNPDPEEVAKWELWNGGVAPTFLTTYLRRLLFMNDFIVTDPHPKRTRMMFPMYDTDGKLWSLIGTPEGCD